MNRMLLTTCSASLMLVGVAGANAANLAGPVEENSQAMAAADHIGPGTSIRQQIEGQLSKDGYTNVQIMPSSFMVRAKDKMGNPVEMVIGPDSFTEVTDVMPKTAATPNAASPAPKTAAGVATPPKG